MIGPNDINYQSNGNFEIIKRIFFNENNGINIDGILLVFLPLILVIISFFVFRYYFPDNKKQTLYLLIFTLLYIIYFVKIIMLSFQVV